MNFIEFESAQKLRGGFYTPPEIAAFLIRWVKGAAPATVLEPSCGDGVFFEAMERENLPSLKRIAAFELDSEEAEKARSRTNLRPNVLNEDFLAWFLTKGQNSERFDAAVGNPPFIRYQYLPAKQQLLAEKIFASLGLPFTKHTNAWVPFVLASINLLRPGGRLAMVIPSELFHIPHAQSLRRYLVAECSKVLIYDPEEIWFNDTLQGTVLLLAEKKLNISDKNQGVAVISIANRRVLETNPERAFQERSYINGATIEGKWMPVFLSVGERDLLAQSRRHPDIKPFSEVASVDVGIVTGANKFFLVPDSVVSEYKLQHWAHPMFGRSDHVRGLIYSDADHQFNKESGLPANFLWFQEEEYAVLPKNVREYLEVGLQQKLHTRFKCRTRKIWYKVPSVYAASVGMLKRAHHYPRLILNDAGAYTTDTAYRIKPIAISAEALVAAFVNSLTCLTAEMEGRHYGGGVLELVPSEIERLLLPTIASTHKEVVVADTSFRRMQDDSAFLKTRDSVVLGNIGFSKKRSGTFAQCLD